MQLPGIYGANISSSSSSSRRSINYITNTNITNISSSRSISQWFANSYKLMLEQTPYSNLTVSDERLLSIYNNSHSNTNTMTTTAPPTTTTAATISSISTPSSLSDMLHDVSHATFIESTEASSIVSSTNGSALNVSYVSVAATNYNDCSALFVNYTQPQTGEVTASSEINRVVLAFIELHSHSFHDI